jgi:septum formation protein
MRQIILASGSPRRKELMTKMGLEFTVVPSNFEEVLNPDKPTADVAVELALGKARTVAEQHPDALVIGSDTIVTTKGVQLGKPKDLDEARKWLHDHAGQDALITTSVVLVCKELNLEKTHWDDSLVHFKPLDEAAIEAYLATGDWADKAGGWGMQSGAAPLVEFMEGRYDTVLGLPTHLVAGLLYSQGIRVQPLDLQPPVPQK